MLKALNPVRFKAADRKHLQLVQLTMNVKEGGQPMKKYAVAFKGEIVCEGPAASKFREARRAFHLETSEQVALHMPTAFKEDRKETPRWLREEVGS